MKNQRSKSFYCAPIFALLFFGLGYLTPGARASTLIVSSEADSGRGTLREAVARASSGDAIVFDPAVRAIVLTSGEIVINTSLIIQGRGADVLSISGNAASRIFRIGKGLKVTITGVELQKGRSADWGGAIYNEGALLLRDVFIKRNSARHGGGIYSTGSITVDASTIYLNEGEYGGGVSVSATADSARFINSTVSRNTTTSDDGGGLTARSRLLSVIHCTIVENVSTTGSHAAGGLQALAANTFVSNSIISDNRGPQFNDVLGAINSQGSNIVGDPNGNTGQWDVTDIFGISPSLGALQYNNGGKTPTYAPLSGSPAIDAGDESNSTDLDQNDSVRLRGATVDIGALETQPTVQTITVQNANDSGPGSFREAVANSQPGDIIDFVTDHVVLSASAPITINHDLVIRGPGTNLLRIYVAAGPGAGWMINVSAGTRVRISGVKFMNFAIQNRGDLFLTNIDFVEVGGYPFPFMSPLHSDTGSLTLNNCLISDSHLRGIYIQSGRLIMNNSSILRNRSIWDGGGIYFNGSIGRIRNSTIAQNATAGTFFLNGGGIYMANGYLTLTNTTIAGNRTDNRGAGMYVGAGANASLTNCTVTGNVSNGAVAGIYSHSNVQIKNTIVAGNINPWAPGDKDITGYIISAGNNLIGHVGTSSGYVSTDLLNVSALLSPLGNYGGPTQTVALQSGSPAINAGDNYLAPLRDQRGVTRLFVGNTVDIGAYESP